MIVINISEKKELFDFAASVLANLEKIHDAKINIVSMYGQVTQLKYSLRLHEKIPQLIRVSNDRSIQLNPIIAKQLSVELVTVSIIWAHMRPDFSEGIEGDKETDLEAVKIVVEYYKPFDKATFLMEFNRLINNNGTNDARVKAMSIYLNAHL